MMLASLVVLVAATFGLPTGTNVLAKGESISIDARRCDMDRKSGIVMFEGDVRVDYRPGYSLSADRVFAIFVHTNELERLVANGNVAVSNETRVGVCDRAVFWRKSNEVELSAWPDGRLARLSDGSANAMAGRKIKFWTQKEQVEIIGAELMVNKGGRNFKDL